MTPLVIPSTYSLALGNVTFSTGEETGRNQYVVDSSPDMRHFLFINGFSLIESVTAFTKYSMEYDIQSDTYSVPKEIDFRQNTQIINYAQDPLATFGMSSGYVNREWAEWWISEFLTTKSAWMLVGSRFLPVSIIPEETTEIYDRSKPGLLAVNFSVRFSFTGGTYNSFVR